MRRATVLSFAMAICLPVATLGQSPDADQSIRPLLNYNTEELGNAEADLGAGIVDDDNAEFKDLLRQGPLASPTAPAPPVPESVDDQAVPSDDFAANLEAPSNTPVPMGLSSLGVTRDSYSAMPSMIGDTSAGGCGVVRFDGGIPIASVMHPTFACSRLNIAENNNAALRDRVYLSYRHFQDASSVSVFPGVPNGGQANQNIDRVTFGIERRLTDLMSIEVRVPVNHQLSSDLSFSQLTGPLVGGPPVVSLPLNDVGYSLGNIGVIFKTLLCQSDDVTWSGGVAVNLPTAPNVRLRGVIHDERFVFHDPSGLIPDVITPVNFAFESTIRNELLTVAPFTAFAITLNEDWFTQGFGQLDVPLTPLVGSINSQLSVPDFGFNPSPVSESGNIEIQKIMRLSLGVGRYLYRANGRQLALMSELHYTTTIEDAKLSEVQVIDAIPPLLPETTVQIGNIANRTDVLDIVIGLPVSIGQWRFINGVVAPLRPAPDRGFSWEYNSMIGKQF